MTTAPDGCILFWYFIVWIVLTRPQAGRFAYAYLIWLISVCQTNARCFTSAAMVLITTICGNNNMWSRDPGVLDTTGRVGNQNKELPLKVILLFCKVLWCCGRPMENLITWSTWAPIFKAKDTLWNNTEECRGHKYNVQHCRNSPLSFFWY